MNKYKFAILKNESREEHLLWIKALKNKDKIVNYEIIDLTKSNWLERIKQRKADLFLTKPPGMSSLFKQLYDERIWIINKVLGFAIYPSYEEIIIYENKKLLSYWLKANDIPHPRTSVFYNKDEIIDQLNSFEFPVVGKFNIGASGYGIKILKSTTEGNKYIQQAFSHKGLSRKWGPNFKYADWGKRFSRYIKGERKISERVSIYRKQKIEVQKGFVIFQEFIPHDFEWRCVRIGESFFAHKKIIKGRTASGSLLKDYSNPPLDLLDFVKRITDKTKISSAAIDVFEYPSKNYLINEIQCFFGQSDPYQMMVNSKPGRYRYIENQWIFEEGDFCTNECYDLRLEHALSLINQK